MLWALELVRYELRRARPGLATTTPDIEPTPSYTFPPDRPDPSASGEAGPTTRELVADFANGQGYQYVIHLDLQEPVGDFVEFEYGNPGQIRFRLASNPASFRVDNRTPNRPAGVLDTHGLYVSFYWPVPAGLRNSFTAFADGVIC